MLTLDPLMPTQAKAVLMPRMIGGLNLRCLFESAALARNERIKNNHKATLLPFPEKVTVMHAKGLMAENQDSIGFILGHPYGEFSLGVFTFAIAAAGNDNIVEESVGPIIWLKQGKNLRQVDCVQYGARAALYRALTKQGEGRTYIVYKNDEVGLKALEVAKQKYSVKSSQQEPINASPA